MAMDHSEIAKRAKEKGLLYLGASALNVDEDFVRFERWLETGWHAGMGFMEKHLPLRREPEKLLPGAKRALVFALPYYQGDTFALSSGPMVAQYARFEDYHKVFRRDLSGIAESLGLAGTEFRVVIDSAPLLERAIAAQTERGFIGKNTCYIHPEWGSFLLLGEVLTTRDVHLPPRVEINPSQHLPQGGCGKCDRCQVKCPTGALDEAYRLDARKCLSYWTIEHRGTVPTEYWKWFEWYWFGCDICQLVCPYNRKTEPAGLPERIKTRKLPPLHEVVSMDQKSYEKWFGGTPLTRAGKDGLRRNALIAMVATQDERLSRTLEGLTGESAPVLRDTVAQIPEFYRRHDIFPERPYAERRTWGIEIGNTTTGRDGH